MSTAAIVPSIECFFNQSSTEQVFVLDYNNGNGFAINVPVSSGTNADGSMNRIDLTAYNGSSTYQAGPSSELPTSFQPGFHRNAGAVAVANATASSSSSTFTWAIGANARPTEYDDFVYNPGSGNGASTGDFTGSENQTPYVLADLPACSRADANVARRMLHFAEVR